MSEIDGSFFSWLAAQPAFVEVALGAAFVTFVAPAVLAAVATAISQLESWLVARLATPAQASRGLAHPLRASTRIS